MSKGRALTKKKWGIVPDIGGGISIESSFQGRNLIPLKELIHL